MAKLLSVFIVISFFLTVSCDNNTNAESDKEQLNDEADAVDENVEIPDEVDNETSDETAEETPDDFDVANPGYSVDFFFADMNMMGSPTAIIVGYIMKTAREDLDAEDEGPTHILDTCVIGEQAPREPKCTSKEDCAPEQECLPEEQDGKPIENSERCVTPNREPLDVGPIKIKGFAAGEQTFLYEPNDKVYKLNGEGDGSVDPSLVTYNQQYELYAENPTLDDLDPFSGEFFLGNKLELTSHTIVSDGGSGFPFIELDMMQPLTFKWTGNESGYVEMTITAMLNMNTSVSISCTVEDDGEFTVPPEYASQLIFGTGMMAQMASMFTMTRKSTSKLSGETVSSGKIGSDQVLLTNIRPKQ